MREANAKPMFETAEQKLIRYEHVIKLQMAEIAKLRTENKRLLDWITGEGDALTCLQSIYQNPESSEYTKIKAATGALPFERPKLSVAVSVRGSDRQTLARLLADFIWIVRRQNIAGRQICGVLIEDVHRELPAQHFKAGHFRPGRISNKQRIESDIERRR